MGAKAGGGDGAHGVAQRIEGRHTPEPEGHSSKGGEGHVQDPEDSSGLRDAGYELVLGRPRCLRLVQRQTADAQDRQDRDSDQHHPHPADPLSERAPQQQRTRPGLEVRQNGRSGRRKARDGLEQSIDSAQPELSGEHVRDGPNEAGSDPAQGNDQERRAMIQDSLPRANGAEQEGASAGAGRDADGERQPRLAQRERDEGRRQQGGTQRTRNHAE